ncbi:hypothetical protein D3C77_652060 [compost metagenome]
MPNWAPMVRAVSAWSPVIILTRMPACWHSATAAMASLRGGSMMPTSASRVKPLSMSSKSSWRWSAATSFSAITSMRRPLAAVSVNMRRQ